MSQPMHMPMQPATTSNVAAGLRPATQTVKPRPAKHATAHRIATAKAARTK